MTIFSPDDTQIISDIQRFLRQLSYHNPEIIPVPIDGIWNSDTERALKSFQRKYELPPTGKADALTLDTLFNEYKRSVALHTTPEKLTVFSSNPDGYILNTENIWEITILRHILAELARNYAFIDATDGSTYEPNVGINVALFQKQNGLPETSLVDKTTWDELASQYNRSVRRYEE